MLVTDKFVQTCSELAQKSVAEVGTETFLVWSTNGFQCKNCTKPPVLPRSLKADDVARTFVPLDKKKRRKNILDGMWTILMRDEEKVNRCLHRLCFYGKSCVDYEGNRWPVVITPEEVLLIGGKLTIEGDNLLHRDGRNGMRFSYTRGNGGRDFQVTTSPPSLRQLLTTSGFMSSGGDRTDRASSSSDNASSSDLEDEVPGRRLHESFSFASSSSSSGGILPAVVSVPSVQ